jgi:hypothetical protein
MRAIQNRPRPFIHVAVGYRRDLVYASARRNALRPEPHRHTL